MLKVTPRKRVVTSAIVGLLCIGLLSVISILLLNSKKDCRTNACGEIFRDKSVIQDIKFSFLNKSAENIYKKETNNSIKITRYEKSINIGLPQLKPEASNLKIELKNIQDNSKIEVEIIQSKSIYIFVDNNIAFTHRYEMPVFNIDPNDLTMYDGIDSSTQKIEANYLIEFPKALGIAWIGLMLILIVAITNLASITFQTKPIVSFRPDIYNPLIVLGVSFFWIISLLIYMIKPFDPVGAQNPGLFGPIGAAFSDYFQIAQISQFNQPYELGGVNYPPTALLFGKVLFYLLPGSFGFIIFASACLGLIYKFIRELNFIKSPSTMLLFVFFYPLIFGLVRGNFDILAICLVFYSIKFMEKSNGRIAAFLLALAIAIKVWPIVFLLYLLRWKNIKVLLESVIYALVLTIGSAYLLGYSIINNILEVISSSFTASDNITTQAFRYCFSLTAVIFITHLFITAESPWNPLKTEIQESVFFTDGLYAKFILLVVLLLLLIGLFKSKKKRETFLFISGIALLIPTPSYTYRGAILLGYFILFSHEFWRDKLDNGGRDTFLNKVQLAMWIPIFAPSTFVFARNSEISTASFIQPISLLIILGIQLFFLFSKESYFQSRRRFPRITS
jgi:hypothetical protein